MADPPRRVMINELVCEGCGDCSVQSNCLSVEPIETEFGASAGSTNLVQQGFSCLNGFCPSFVTVEGAPCASRAPRAAPPEAPQPEVAPLPPGKSYGIVITASAEPAW